MRIIRYNAPQCLLTEMNTQHQYNVHHIQLIAAPNLSLWRHRRCRSICLFVTKKKPAHDGAYAMSVDRGTYTRHSYEGTAHTLFKWRRAYESTHNHGYARIVCVMYALIRINGTAATDSRTNTHIMYIHIYTHYPQLIYKRNNGKITTYTYNEKPLCLRCHCSQDWKCKSAGPFKRE